MHIPLHAMTSWYLWPVNISRYLIFYFQVVLQAILKLDGALWELRAGLDSAVNYADNSIEHIWVKSSRVQDIKLVSTQHAAARYSADKESLLLQFTFAIFPLGSVGQLFMRNNPWSDPSISTAYLAAAWWFKAHLIPWTLDGKAILPANVCIYIYIYISYEYILYIYICISIIYSWIKVKQYYEVQLPKHFLTKESAALPIKKYRYQIKTAAHVHIYKTAEML